MNQRLVDIFKESHGYFPSPMGEPEAEKFANLIIDECISIVGDGGEFANRFKLIERIRERFGIEDND